MPVMEKSCRLLDFNIYDELLEKEISSGSESDEQLITQIDNKRFIIQIFGINEKGETFCLFVNDYKPFFYIKVDDEWDFEQRDEFMGHIKNKVGKYYENSIVECKLIKKKKLYGFDGGKDHKFILIKFNNTIIMNKVKNLFYAYGKNTGRRLKENGYIFNNTNLYLYEANIPPLLRYFHIKEISPSGWICIPLKKAIRPTKKTTSCKYEFSINHQDIVPLNKKEDPCSL